MDNGIVLRRGKLALLLASSSIGALLIGGGAPPAFAQCAISPTTDQASVTNSSAINCININGITVTGDVTNTGPPTTGVITATGVTRATETGIIVQNASIGGTIVNAGQIITAGTGGNGILITGNATVAGGIRNSGTITLGAAGIIGGNGIMVGDFGSGSVTISSFGGGIANSGTISTLSGGGGVFIGGKSINGNGIWLGGLVTDTQTVTISTFSGGISNSGTISAQVNGIWVGGIISIFSSAAKFTMSTFAGGISNSGTIVAGGNGIWIGTRGLQFGPSAMISTFTGGIGNSGMISAGRTGIAVDSVLTFSGGISNSAGGTITAGNIGIAVSSVSTFSGGISNFGTISGSTGVLVSNSGAVSLFDSGVIVGTGGTAVDLSGNAAGNMFTLGPGYSITGNVLGQGADEFQLGGSGTGSFDLSTIGPSQQYRGFTTFNVVSGTWTASGTYRQTDPWTVQGGSFLVNGDLSSASLLTVTGGTLGGTGQVGNTQINGGGTFAPGTPGVPGTAMTVAGNLAFQSGALYIVQVNPTTASRASVTGTATLAGNVLAAFAAGSYMTRSYDILHAAGLSGSFAALGTTNLPSGFAASLSYTATDVFLNLQAQLGVNVLPQLGSGGLNGNQQAVATAINNFFNDGGALTPNFLSLFGLSGGNLATALTQLSGEAATGAQQASMQMMTEFLTLMLDPSVNGRAGSSVSSGASQGYAREDEDKLPPDIALAYAKAPPLTPSLIDRRWSAWGAAYGGSAVTNGNAAIGSHDFSARTFGFAAGMDYHYTADTAVGFALAGGGTNWGLAQGLGGGRSDALQVGVHGITHAGPAYLSGALAFANYLMSTDRTAFAGDHLTAGFNAQSYGARLEAGYRYGMAALGVTPYAALQTQSFHTPSYTENDLTAGGFGLGYASRNATDTRSELGARFDSIHTFDAMPLILRARAAWAHDWVSDPALTATFQTLPGASFVVNGATPAHNSALTSAGAELYVTSQLSVAAKFDGEFASGSRSYAGTGTMRYVW